MPGETDFNAMSYRRKKPIRRFLFKSIKGQIFIVFAVALLSLVFLTLLNFWNVSVVKNRLLLNERYDDFLNHILELRRFEKNFLLYKDIESLREGVAYLQRIDELMAELSPDIVKVTDQASFQDFLTTLGEYELTVMEINAADGKAFHNDEEIRRQGKKMADFAERLCKTKRQRVHKALFQTSLLPFAFLSVFLLLMLLVIKLISLGLLQPMKALHAATQQIARGDYSPASQEDGLHTDEINGLIRSFNRMAQELEVNQDNLLQARKIAALGTFTAGIAHELNNPLNNISLSTEAYLEAYGDRLDDAAREMIEDIMAQSERAGEIVKNLLDFSRTERPEFSSLDAAEILHRTLVFMKNQILLAKVELKIDFSGHLPHVRGNFRNLQQVFMNLLLNALQAMPDGGHIFIRIRHDQADFVRFDIEDTGKGIEPQALEHIFEPFFTTKRVGQGTGLGLSVTYAIVKRHGGRIEVKSQVGKGTIFSVFLPVDRTQEEDRPGNG